MSHVDQIQASSTTNSRCASSPKRTSTRLIPADDPLPCEACDQFSLLSYNILSYKYLSPESPAFVAKSPEKLEWTLRRGRILALLERSEADVICLQEIETPTFDCDFGDHLAELGYSFVVQKMKNSKKKAKPHTTGVATIFRSSKFTCVWENHRSRTLLIGLRPNLASSKALLRGNDFVDSDPSRLPTGDVAIAPGSDVDDSKHSQSIPELAGDEHELVYVANCHLEGHPSVENIRFNQIRSLFNQLDIHQKRHNKLKLRQHEECQRSKHCQVIVCGDFNCSKDSRVYELMSTGKLAGGCTDRFYPEVVITDKEYLSPFPPLRHAYDDLSQQYATYARSPGWSTIDFIWYNAESLHNVATREVISPLKMAELVRGGSGIPNFEQPSDHMPVAAVFQLKS